MTTPRKTATTLAMLLTALLAPAGASGQSNGPARYVYRNGRWIQESAPADAPDADSAPDANAPSDPNAPPSLQRLRQAQQLRDRARGLVARLADANGPALDALTAELLAVGEPARVPLKLAELSDNFELRRRAMGVSRRLRWHLVAPAGLQEQFPDLVATMVDGNTTARQEQADRVAQSGRPDAIVFLRECLADADAYIRQRAVDGMVNVYEEADYDDQKAVRARIRPIFIALLDEADQDVRLLALGAMMRTRTADVPRLSELLDDPSMEVRATALKALGYSRDPKAVPHVLSLLDDPRWRVRAACLEALGQLVDSDKAAPARRPVQRRLRDEEPFVRDSAATLLGEWRDKASEQALYDAWKEGLLSETAALPALAAMRGRYGKQEILARYADANDTLQKAALLSYLDGYDPDRQVDDLIAKAMTDEAMRPAWAQVCRQAVNRNRIDLHWQAVAEKLLDADANLAESVWEGMSWRIQQRELPAEVERTLLETSDPVRCGYALMALYARNANGCLQQLCEYLDHADPHVVATALALVAGDQFEDTLQADAPRYRNSDRARYDPHTGDRIEEPQPLPQTARGKVVALLDSSDALVRLRAAAVQYRTGREPNLALPILRKALASGLPRDRLITLAAICMRPAPLRGLLDLPALAEDAETRDYAVKIIASLGDAKLVPLLIRIAGDDPDEELLGYLIRSGQDAAVRRATQAFGKDDSYRIVSFAESELKRMPGPGAVAFLRWAMLEHKWDSDDGWEYQRLVTVLTDLPDRSAEDLLAEVLQLIEQKKVPTSGGDMQMGPKILARLIEKDPNRYAGQLREALLANTYERAQTLSGLLRRKDPSAELVDLVVQAAASPKGRELDWPGLAEWAPAETFWKRMLPELDRYHETVQVALLARAGTEADANHLGDLLSARPRGMFSPQLHAAVIAGAVSARGLDRPLPDGVPTAARESVLIASGDWPDAPRLLRPYLRDANDAVARAARTGLAYYVLGYGEAGLDANDANVLLSAVRTDGPVGGYLAAEAVEAGWPSRLREIPVEELRGSATVARGLMARATDLTDDQRDVVRGMIHGGRGETATYLSRRTAELSGDPNLLRLLPQASDDEDEDDGYIPITMRVDRNFFSGRDPNLFRELIDKALTVAGEVGDGGWSGDVVETPVMVSAAISWAPDEMPDWLMSKIATNTTPGVLAGAVAWLRYGQEAGRLTVMEAARGSLSRSGTPSKRMSASWEALSAGLDARYAGELLPYLKDLDANGDDAWTRQKFRSKAALILASPDPNLAGALRRSMADSDNYGRDLGWQLHFLGADLPRDPNDDEVVSTWGLDHLVEALAYGDANYTPDLLPPWDLRSDASPAETPPWADAVLEEDYVPPSPVPLMGIKGGSLLMPPGGTANLESNWEAASLVPQSSGYTPEQFYLSYASREWDERAAAGSPEQRKQAIQPWLRRGFDAAGFRLAALYGATECNEAIERACRVGDANAVEPAWALAAMKGDAAAPAVLEAYHKATDFTVRVRLACLLRLLGHDEGEADIRGAMALRAIRGFRFIFVRHVVPQGAMDVERFITWDSDDGPLRHMGSTEDIWDDLLPFDDALQAAVPDLLAEMHRRYPAIWKYSWRGEVDANARPTIDLSDMRLYRTKLSASLSGHGLPITPLAMVDENSDALFARLCTAEQAMEPHCYVQFAGRAGSLAELYVLWRQWWQENRDRPREQWWRQAVDQSADELTHARWWIRCRAAARLARLTGRMDDLPAVMDANGWRTLQQDWRGWIADHADRGPAACIVAAAIEANALPADGKDADQRAMLVRLAGEGGRWLSQAAMIQLETADCTAGQLAQQARSWQGCPRWSLRHWCRGRLDALADRPRLRHPVP